MLTRRAFFGVSGLVTAALLGVGEVGPLAGRASAAGSALERLRAALASPDTVRLVALGSSTTAGTGSTTKSARYVDLLARQLQADRGRTDGGIYLDVDGGWKYTGTTSAGTAGLALKCRRLEPGAVMTRSTSVANCTAVTVTYAEGPGCGPFTVRLGGATHTITPRTDGTAVAYTGVFRTPSQPVGSKSLRITALTTAVTIDGCYAHNGDETTGVQVWQGGKKGATAASFRSSTTLPSRLRSLAVQGAVVMVGSNDYAAARPISTYTADVTAIVAALRAASPGVVVMLVHSWQRMDVTAPRIPWSAYGAALKGIADADPATVVFLDLSDDFALRGVPGSDPESLIGSDGVHGTNAGHRLLSELVHAPLAGLAAPPEEDPPPPATLTLFSSDAFAHGDALTCVGRVTDAVLGGTPRPLLTSSTAAALAVSSGELVRGGTRAGQFAALRMPTADQSLSVRVLDPPNAGGSGGISLTIRRAATWTSASYRASLGPTSAVLERTDANGVATRLAQPVAVTPGDTVEISAVGPTISLYRNGELVVSVQDTTVTAAGHAGLSVGSWASGFRCDDLVWRTAA
ncbi:SGNH/GDSL hydrolase family protein [Modestobacter lacusdianchii]